MSSRLIDLTGQRFGRLVVLSQATSKGKSARWLCRCDCGNTSTPFGFNLRKGQAISCGCYNRAQHVDMAREMARANIRHGQTGTPEWQCWMAIKQRCLNPNVQSWPYYGGRGITLCDAWVNNFSAFVDHIGPKPGPEYSIDRIDNERGYEPGNVRWATRQEQSRNRHPRSRSKDGRWSK